MLEVQTVFRRPTLLNTEALPSEGSQLIRSRVFEKILEAEKEANKTQQDVSITPSNYNFALLGQENCDGTACYRLRIISKQKSKYSINGQIWVDAEDGAIIRLQGSPAQRPSFWTLSTEIERQYKCINGVWLCVEMDSSSDIFITGRSTLRADYDYVDIQTEGISGE